MRIHPTAIIDPRATLADSVEVGPYCCVGPNVSLADGVVLQSHVSLTGDVTIGVRTMIHPFAVIGAPPQHLGYKGEATRVEIGAECIVREQATIHRGTLAGGGVTRIGDRCFLMSGAHVGHDCAIGDQVVIASHATLGGHVKVGAHVFIGGVCGVHQHSRIGDFAMIGGCAAVTTDVIPYGSAIGNHAALEGLNIIGMKRRGLPRDAIHHVRRAYRRLFWGEGAFTERVDSVATEFTASAEVARIVAFIRADARRPIMKPQRRSDGEL